MIKGIDVSRWQGTIDWPKVTGIDFAILKATQGTTLVDAQLSRNRTEARKRGILLGFYHFANGGDPVAEADHFVKNVGTLQTGELLVLDWEIPHKDPAGWSRKFLDRVKEKTGVKALLYTNEARVISIDWTPVVKGDYGLWVAKYGDNDTNPEPHERPNDDEWPFYVLWQYSSTGTVPGISGRVDLNIADISLDTLKKYGKQAPACTHCCPLHCK